MIDEAGVEVDIIQTEGGNVPFDAFVEAAEGEGYNDVPSLPIQTVRRRPQDSSPRVDWLLLL